MDYSKVYEYDYEVKKIREVAEDEVDLLFEKKVCTCGANMIKTPTRISFIRNKHGFIFCESLDNGILVRKRMNPDFVWFCESCTRGIRFEELDEIEALIS